MVRSGSEADRREVHSTGPVHIFEGERHPMEDRTVNRRGFLGRLAAVFGGLAAIPALASPAFARSRVRFGFPGYGFGRGFRSSHYRRFYGGGYGYPPAYGGYGGYYRPYQPYYAPAPYVPAPAPYYSPYYGQPGGIYFRLNGPAKRPITDALALLEA